MLTAGSSAQAPTPATPARPPSTTVPAAISDAFVNRVWVVVASTGVTPGTLYVFLSDGALVISSKGNPPGVGRWSRSSGGLVITEEGRDYKTDVIALTADRFQIRMHNPGPPTEITLAPAPPRADGQGDPGPGHITPLPTTWQCGDDTYKVAFEEGTAYVTMPDGGSITLPRLRGGDQPPSRRTYTNGRLTFVEVRQGATPDVLVARGRMAHVRCTQPPAAR
ncbi:MAG TPA: hypothetical protein VMF13_14970 [Luteitalea sp.]|nr:hypothetical protein [Luteitalea sp.]